MFSYSLMYSESEVCSGRIESSLIGGPHHKIFILVQFYGLTKYTHLFDCIHNKLFRCIFSPGNSVKCYKRDPPAPHQFQALVYINQ